MPADEKETVSVGPATTIRLSESLKVLRSQIDERWPTRDKASDGWMGDAAHQGRESDHNPDNDGTVDALDVTHDPTVGCDVGRIAEAIRQSRDRRVTYMIFDRRICSATNQPWQWRTYSGPHPHTTHLHVSVGDRYQDDPTPWDIGATSDPLFEGKVREWAPRMLADLADDDVTNLDVAAIFGNFGHETGGFVYHSEIGNPDGGIGWAQWTGSRRTQFEQWAAERNLDERSDEANYGFAIHELTRPPEDRVLPLMAEHTTLRNKTIEFCDTYERPGVSAYDKRIAWAERAIVVLEQGDTPPPPPLDVEEALKLATTEQLGDAITARGYSEILLTRERQPS